MNGQESEKAERLNLQQQVVDLGAEQKAAELLPCIHIEGGFAPCLSGVSNMCESCLRRPAVAAALAEHTAEIERLKGERALSVDREWLGKLVRRAWVKWAREQPDGMGPSWFEPWERLEERHREVCRRIGEFIASQCVTPELLKVEARLKHEKAMRAKAEFWQGDHEIVERIKVCLSCPDDDDEKHFWTDEQWEGFISG